MLALVKCLLILLSCLLKIIDFERNLTVYNKFGILSSKITGSKLNVQNGGLR